MKYKEKTVLWGNIICSYVLGCYVLMTMLLQNLSKPTITFVIVLWTLSIPVVTFIVLIQKKINRVIEGDEDV